MRFQVRIVEKECIFSWDLKPLDDNHLRALDGICFSTMSVVAESALDAMIEAGTRYKMRLRNSSCTIRVLS